MSGDRESDDDDLNAHWMAAHEELLKCLASPALALEHLFDLIVRGYL